MKILYFSILVSLAKVGEAQPKNGVQLFLGLSAPQAYNVPPTLVNDSTAVYLGQNDDPREYIGLSYHHKINKLFHLFSQIIICERSIRTNVYTNRYIGNYNGRAIYLSGVQPLYYGFFNIANLSGLSYDWGKFVSISFGVGFATLDQKYKSFNIGGSNPNIDDIAIPLSQDIIKKYSITYGYSIALHYKGIYLTARYQENLHDDSKGFEYYGTKYPLYGRTSSINLDLGYRFSW